jgi:hypothetical protein
LRKSREFWEKRKFVNKSYCEIGLKVQEREPNQSVCSAYATWSTCSYSVLDSQRIITAYPTKLPTTTSNSLIPTRT